MKQEDKELLRMATIARTNRMLELKDKEEAQEIMKPKDQLIKKLNKMKDRIFIASPFICKKCKEISRRDNVTLFIDTIDEVISEVKSFMKGYNLVKETDYDSLKSSTSHLQKRLIGAKKRATEYMKCNNLRKEQLARVSEWVDNLVIDGRVTGKELKKVFPTKNSIKEGNYD